MSTSIGHTFMYNMIIFFILIFFAFISASMSYYKAYKVNSLIVKTIEKYEGYNDLAIEEINRNLSNLGYSVRDYETTTRTILRRINGTWNRVKYTITDKTKCASTYKEMYLVSSNSSNKYNYCVYINDKEPEKGEKYIYGVLTYMQIDLPVVNIIKLPVFTKTNYLYKFTDK